MWFGLPTGSDTPIQPMQAPVLKTGLVLVSVLRAGLGFLEGILPNLPKIIPEDQVFVLDPMLATGHTVIHAFQQVEAAGARNIHLVTLLASPEGVTNVQKAFPSVRIVTASIDTKLNYKGYIVPGLGDAGDHLYGTLGH